MSLTQHILAFAGTFNGWLVLSVFIMLILAEFSIAIPYVMETVWMLIGYNVSTGAFSIFHLALLWLVGVIGREIGAWTLYQIAGLGRGPIMRLYNRLFGKVISERLSEGSPSNSLPARLLRRINLLSPFSITFGRLIWLRVPLTIILSMRRQLKLVVESVALFSVVWDGIYLLIGVIGGKATVSPTRFILYSVIGLTVLYTIFFIGRRTAEWWLKRRQT
jgi:membrane protein DedA with SNARE-associated domain